ISTDMSSAPSSAPASSTSALQQASNQGGLRYPTNRKTIYDRNLNRSRNAELSRASFAYLFGEMVGYAQRRVTGIQDLEKRYGMGKALFFFSFPFFIFGVILRAQPPPCSFCAKFSRNMDDGH